MIHEHNSVIKIIFRTQMIFDTCDIGLKPVTIIRPPIFDIEWMHSLEIAKCTRTSNTVEPANNDHLYNAIDHLLFI